MKDYFIIVFFTKVRFIAEKIKCEWGRKFATIKKRECYDLVILDE